MAPLKNRYTESKSQKNHFHDLIWLSVNNKIEFSSKKPAKSWTKKVAIFFFFFVVFFFSRAYGKIEPPLELRKAVKKFFGESSENENWIREQIKTRNNSKDEKPFRETHSNSLFGKYPESIQYTLLFWNDEECINW